MRCEKCCFHLNVIVMNVLVIAIVLRIVNIFVIALHVFTRMIVIFMEMMNAVVLLILNVIKKVGVENESKSTQESV